MFLCVPQLQDWQIQKCEGETTGGIVEISLFVIVLGVLWLNGNSNGHSNFLLLPQLLDWFLFFCMAAVLMLNLLRTATSSAFAQRSQARSMTPVDAA